MNIVIHTLGTSALGGEEEEGLQRHKKNDKNQKIFK